ncbi:MAG: hypothetical protein CM15mP47_1190 [Methanobacteriota archaeon]|nr:MAG: hypothetical protein CM15mP47_1190 [Euryarchaeota archaeon]
MAVSEPLESQSILCVAGKVVGKGSLPFIVIFYSIPTWRGYFVVKLEEKNLKAC